MQETNKHVHGLWIGNALTAIEILCIQSYIQNGHSFHLWHYEPIQHIPDNCIPCNANEIIPFDAVFSYTEYNKFGHGKGSYAGFSDIFRYKLFLQYSGWWTDMDIVCLQPLDFDSEYVFRKNGKKGIVGNVMKCPKNSALMHYCYERALNEISANNKHWMLPITILNDGIQKFQLQQFVCSFTNDDSWPLVSTYITHQKKFDNHWKAFHWMNEEWRRYQLDKNIFIQHSCIQQLLADYSIPHTIYTTSEATKIKSKLNKWNYMLINLKARWNWYKQHLKNKH